MYAIKNKLTGKWLYGTDFRTSKPVQRTSENRCMIFETYEDAKLEVDRRRCSRNYQIVKVKVIEDGV